MERAERFEWVLKTREQALQGRSGSEVARWLLHSEGLHRFAPYQILHDAFGMHLRDARECEVFLNPSTTTPSASIDTVWGAYLTDPSLWPRRIVQVDLQESQPFTATVHLFDFTLSGAQVLLDWGDGKVEEQKAAPVCSFFHTYTSLGTYAFRCTVTGEPRMVVTHSLTLKAGSSAGTLSQIFFRRAQD